MWILTNESGCGSFWVLLHGSSLAALVEQMPLTVATPLQTVTIWTDLYTVYAYYPDESRRIAIKPCR